MRLFTLLVFSLCALFLEAQTVHHIYDRGIVDDLMQSTCIEKRAIDPSAIEYDYASGFIRFKEVGTIYNPDLKQGINRVQFILIEDVGQYIKVTGKGMCTVHLSTPFKREGLFYAILSAGDCVSLIEYEVTGNQEQFSVTGKLFQCCRKVGSTY